MLTEKTNTQEITQKTFDYKCFEGTDRFMEMQFSQSVIHQILVFIGKRKE